MLSRASKSALASGVKYYPTQLFLRGDGILIMTQGPANQTIIWATNTAACYPDAEYYALSFNSNGAFSLLAIANSTSKWNMTM